jgi:hypothetical protein
MTSIGKDLDGSGRGLIEVIVQHFSGGTEKNQETSQSRQSESRPIFETNTY